MLKLGEWSDLQRADIDSALTRITSRQSALLQELREEEENPFSANASTGESSRESEAMLRHRLKAWTRLCFSTLDQLPGLPVTRHSMAMDQLLEVYEKRHGQLLSPLLRLELPRISPLDAPAEAPLIRQMPGLEMTIARLAQPLTPVQATELAAQWKAEEQAWQQLITAQYPPEQAGQCCLEIVYFPGISAHQLMSEGFEGGSGRGEQCPGEAETGCCVGLLRQD